MTLRPRVLAETEKLLEQVPTMTVDDFQTVTDAARVAVRTQNASQPHLRLPAADFSWLDKRVRDTVGPLIGSLPWPSTRLSSRAVFVVLDAAQAIIRRERLTEEQYEAFVGGFRQAGLSVPAWRDDQGA